METQKSHITKNTWKKKYIVYLVIVSVLLSMICSFIAVWTEKEQRDEFIEDLLRNEIDAFSSAAYSLSTSENADTELEKHEFANLFGALGKCYSYSEFIQSVNEEHRFMNTLINEYTLEFRNLFFDQEVYKIHTKEYYQDVISDFLIISHWLDTRLVDESFDQITQYNFNMKVKPKLSESFEEYMDF